MVTREQLRNFRRSKRELKTILALMRQAELRVSADTTRQRDRERAQAEAARYEKAADALAAEQERIETAIQTLDKPNLRRVLYCRYIMGWSCAKTACDMEVSERTVCGLAAEAIRILEKN